MKSEQKLQEESYQFPYHYIAQYKSNRFRHYFLDSWGINYVSTIEYLLGRISADADAKIVDIGCGDGRFSRELALEYPTIEITGIDYSERAIALGSAMNADLENLSFRAIDITKPHDLGKFDVAILMEVLEHIPLADAEVFMGRVRRLLREGGDLYLTVPHINKPLEPAHFQHFTCESVLWCLRNSFEVIEVTPFEKIAWSRKIVSKILSNKFFVLSNVKILSFIYRFYKRNLFFATSERDCQRIFVKARAIRK